MVYGNAEAYPFCDSDMELLRLAFVRVSAHSDCASDNENSASADENRNPIKYQHHNCFTKELNFVSD